MQEERDDSGDLFPSEYTAYAFRMPGEHGLEPFSFDGREYLVPVYDTPAKRLLLLYSRQSEKSTTLANKTLTYSVLRPFLRSLYVSPSEAQTVEFSKERIGKPIRMSPILSQHMQGKDTSDNVMFKEFGTGSSITFRSAHFNADSCRGISADSLVVDEVQNILPEVLPVILECISHSRLKLVSYAGTPLSFDNTLNFYWENSSTKYEWVIPCDHCGGGDYRHWNIIGYDNIQPKGLSCNRCGKLINKNHPHARWASMRDENWLLNPPASVGIPYEGYRICQPLVSWLSWQEILDKKATYGTAAFHNEVLALAYEAGEKLVRRQALIDSSNPALKEDSIKNYVGRVPLFMGIDWGGGSLTENASSFTHVTIIGYDNDKIAVVYRKRFTGREAEPEFVVPEIEKLINKYRVHLIGADYGGGLDKNDTLIRRYGIEKVLRYQYCGAKKLFFDSEMMCWRVNRTECLMAMINAINRTNVFMFPAWETWEHTHAEDYLCLMMERDMKTQRAYIGKTAGKSDDGTHSLLYAFLASMVVYPRPDILQPDKEDPTKERSYR